VLDASAIIAEAEAQVGLSDPETHLHRNLERLVASYNEDGRPCERSDTYTSRGLVRRTTQRLEGLQWIRDHPEILEERIDRPVFLMGLPRSGTTAFLYMFDRDSRFRILRKWEVISPQPPPGFDPDSVKQRMEEEEQRAAFESPRVKALAAMHLMDKNGPEEDGMFLDQAYCFAGSPNLIEVPSFFDYLLDQADLEAAYRIHKRQLQLLQWRLPKPSWALKFPNHVIAQDAILKVYPDAGLVMTHRDPVQIVASIAKLTCTLREARYDSLDRHAVGRQMLHFIRRHADRILEFARGPDGHRTIHVDYYRLLDDPGPVMGEVHARLGIDSPAEVQAAVSAWREANPKGARGANPYALEDYGLDPDEVADQFRDYMTYFDIPREQAGLARVRAS
jgi:hypothetical protein